MALWKTTVDLRDAWSNDNFFAARDLIVHKIRASRWTQENSEIDFILDELSEVANTEDFDVLWNQMYDHADRDRVWIRLF